MIPIRFGPLSRQLAGVFHPAATRRTPSTGVLLCPPLGQEAVRLHRLYRVLAERLAAAGFHVLRLDYFGTGDAAGEDEDGDLEGWQGDVWCAQQELLKRTNCQRTLWVGARLGGSVAALASLNRPEAEHAHGSGRGERQAPHHLLLWEPVIDGPAYLKELAHAHARALATELVGGKATAPRATPPLRGEALGFGLGQALLTQLTQLGPQDFQALPADQVLTLMPPHASSGSGLAGRTCPLDHVFDWTSEEALNTALVPTAVLQGLAQHIEETAA